MSTDGAATAAVTNADEIALDDEAGPDVTIDTLPVPSAVFGSIAKGEGAGAADAGDEPVGAMARLKRHHKS